MLTNDEMDRYGEYLNNLFENKIPFDYIEYKKLMNELKNIKEIYKPDSDIYLYIEYLFEVLKKSKINAKIRKFKLQKIMNYNASEN